MGSTTRLMDIALDCFERGMYDDASIAESFGLDVVPTMLVRDKALSKGKHGEGVLRIGFTISSRRGNAGSAHNATAIVDLVLGTIYFDTIMGSNQLAAEVAMLRVLSIISSFDGEHYVHPTSWKAPIANRIRQCIPLPASMQMDANLRRLFATDEELMGGHEYVIEYSSINLHRCYVMARVTSKTASPMLVVLEVNDYSRVIKFSCRGNDVEAHKQGAIAFYPQVRALLKHIAEHVTPRFFDYDYLEQEFLRDKLDQLHVKGRKRERAELVADSEEGYTVLIPDVPVLDKPSETLYQLGLSDQMLQPQKILPAGNKANRFQLIFLIREWNSYYSDSLTLGYPLPHRGKLNKNGSLSKSVMRLSADKLITQHEAFTNDEIVDVGDYLGYTNSFLDSYLVAYPSDEEIEAFAKVMPILQRNSLYLLAEELPMETRAKYALAPLSPTEVMSPRAEVVIRIEREDPEERGDRPTIKLSGSLRLADKLIKLSDSAIKFNRAFVLYEYQQLYLFRSAADFQMLYYLWGVENKRIEPIRYPMEALPRLYEEVIKPLGQRFEVRSELHKVRPINEEHVVGQLFINDTDEGGVLLTPAMQYGEQSVPLHDKTPFYDADTLTLLDRDWDKEEEFLELLRGLHPDFENAQDSFVLRGEQLIENNWLIEASEKLRQEGIQIFGTQQLKNFKFNLHTPTFNISTSSGIDWFDLKVEIKFGKEVVSLREVRKSIINKSKYVMLSDGTIGILPEDWLERYAKYFQVGTVKKDRLEISNYQFNIIDQLYEDLSQRPKYIEEMMERKRRLQNLSEIEPHPVPKGIQAELRHYQQAGFDWLLFLNENGLGGCLADDMGLGKTLQVITLLQHLKEQKKKVLPHLIVVPTSLLFNWQQELEKFAPGLSRLVYRGAERADMRGLFSQYDIILSTYGVVANDIEQLSETLFGYLILDESQAIKNPFSKRYKAVRALRSENKLALTGTPIENNTFDLYSQMNFLNPGIFGSMDHFREEFANAIDKRRDQKSMELLRDMTQPFLLRRTKKQVATELPDKTESVLYCEMKEEQRRVYDTFKEYYRQMLLDEMTEKGEGEAQMMVLQALMKLRQICNSPELIGTEQEDYGKQSIKLDLLTRNLREVVDEHKVLVFSQFTSMLALIKKRLEAEGIRYVYLDGATVDRQQVVNEFQNDDSVRVFLISLKAGGMGLNLTAADYVFLVDPWWNPAVESQAIDRSYRIGQEKHVNAYRMVCKDTIEEKILQLQDKKRSISEEIIQIDQVDKTFSREDIANLFK
ncbi:DEAD/DEAH box helicase [Porphyromonas levii]|uniref:DEAD/DEAH box helicase n=1 Tax=Porphyromonas levii TaxID=28114 RepID=UPI002011AAD2|nr:DEAD/DEAH box helicase [Porphyromonas levii]MBR8802181.1 RNA polymerase-associated protein RapA [Porphyromonas levii]